LDPETHAVQKGHVQLRSGVPAFRERQLLSVNYASTATIIILPRPSCVESSVRAAPPRGVTPPL
jgi:hypothetical protein